MTNIVLTPDEVRHIEGEPMPTLTLNQMVRRSLELDDLVVERSATGRVVIARALTYGVPYRVSDDGGRSMYNEVWRSGVFDKSLAQRSGRIPMMITHDRRSLPVGATLGAEPNTGAFIFRAKISNTRDGDDALELISDGALTGVSVGARILNNRSVDRSTVERIEAALHEISLTPFGQMSDGQILAVRADIEPETPAATAQPQTTPHLTEAQAYLESLTRP